LLKHFVAEHRKVNKSLFFTQVTLSVELEQKEINLSIRTDNADLFWLFFGRHDLYFRQKALDLDRVRFVSWKVRLFFFACKNIYT
jgi:hypothetical protein